MLGVRYVRKIDVFQLLCCNTLTMLAFREAKPVSVHFCVREVDGPDFFLKSSLRLKCYGPGKTIKNL